MKLLTHFWKHRSFKMKAFAVIALISGISLIPYLIFETWKSYNGRKVTFIKQKWNLTFQYVVVHFDLKGAPPLLSYLRSILQTLKNRGATGLLIEYEDMFPYEGILVNLSAKNHYDRNELKRFLMSVDQIGLEVIPLVPTFGHLEFALKLKEFQHLREHPKFPDSICPSKKESQDLLREMLRQVIVFHRKVAPLKHIHVGCNEVHLIKVCEICTKKKSTNTSIILKHFKFINDVIGDLSPKTKILVWDDMLKDMPPTESAGVKFPNMDSVSLEHSTNISIYRLKLALNQNQRMFGNMWIASAYKGADGSTNTIPILINRFMNHLNLYNFVVKYGSITNKYSFKGIILTGRSRYSHMEPPCELLPVAFPSLILNLILLEKYHKGIGLCKLEHQTLEDFEFSKVQYLNYYITDDLNSALKCQNTFFNGYLETFQAMTCVFEGVDLHVLLTNYEEIKYHVTQTFFGDHVDLVFKKVTKMEPVKLGYHSMVDIKDIVDFSGSVSQDVTALESQVIESMIPYFDKYIIEEYVIFKLTKLNAILYDTIKYLSNFDIVKDWPRRYSDSLTLAPSQNEVDKQAEFKHD